jgi:uncharacterized DUF497 family protein
MLFEWDESKRVLNLAKHHIDFLDAQRIFDVPVFERTEHRHGEERVVAIGAIEDIEIVVVYVVRGERRRLISARRASSNERQEYQKHLEAIA